MLTSDDGVSGVSGDLQVQTGSSEAGASGAMTLSMGTAVNGAGGEVVFEVPGVITGDGGTINIFAGASNGGYCSAGGALHRTCAQSRALAPGRSRTPAQVSVLKALTAPPV